MFDYHFVTDLTTSSDNLKSRCTYPLPKKDILINIKKLKVLFQNYYLIMDKTLFWSVIHVMNKVFNLTKPTIRKTCPKVTFYE